MRRRLHRRNLVVWSQSAGSVGRYSAPPFTRRRWIRRWIRTRRAAHRRRPDAPGTRRARPLAPLASRGGAHGGRRHVARRPGRYGSPARLWLLLSAPLIPGSPKADRMRRPEVEGSPRSTRGEPLLDVRCRGRVPERCHGQGGRQPAPRRVRSARCARPSRASSPPPLPSRPERRCSASGRGIP